MKPTICNWQHCKEKAVFIIPMYHAYLTAYCKKHYNKIIERREKHKLELQIKRQQAEQNQNAKN